MKKIVGFCLLIVSVLLSVSCTFAASGFGGGSRGDGWGSGGFSTGTTSTEVSYDALSSLALELNDRLASGEFGDVLKEVSCNIGVYSTVSGRDKYAIFYHYQASNYWYRNASGGLVYAYKDIDRISDLLGGNNGGIAYFLNRMEYVLTGSLLTAVNSINTATNSLLTTCNTISTKLDTLTSVISNGKVLVDNSDVVSAIQSIPAFDDTDIITAINNIPTYDDSNLISAVTTISNQITEQFGEYDSTYSFPNFSSSGQSAANNKTVSGVLPSAFTSINPGTRQLLYSPSGTLILPKRVLYNGGGDCKNVYCTPYIHQTYGLGYRLEFLFRFSRIQNTPRTETVQFPQVSFTDYSGETFTLSGHSGTVRVSPHRDAVSSYLYYFPRWDASGNWLGWSGQNDTFQFSSSSYEPSKRVYLTPPESGTYYIYGTSDTAIPVVYASRFTGFLQSQTDRVVNAVGSIPAPTDYTSQLTAVAEKLDALLAKSNETVVNVINDNTYVPNVLYLDDNNSAVDTTKDGVSLFGGLVRWLWKNVFDGAFDAADITKLDGLFYDPAAVAEEVPDGS